MKIAFYSTKPYDRIWFEPLGEQYGYEIHFIEFPCTRETLFLAKGSYLLASFSICRILVIHHEMTNEST